jgi:hypothetical protein
MYPHRAYEQLPRDELSNLIAAVQRDFVTEGWDSNTAAMAIKLIVGKAKARAQRRSTRKVRGNLDCYRLPLGFGANAAPERI